MPYDHVKRSRRVAFRAWLLTLANRSVVSKGLERVQGVAHAQLNAIAHTRQVEVPLRDRGAEDRGKENASQETGRSSLEASASPEAWGPDAKRRRCDAPAMETLSPGQSPRAQRPSI